MSSAPTPEYVLPSPLKVSTYTMVCNLNHKIELDILSRCIPIYEKNDIRTNDITGAFISISSYSASNTTDHSRGIISTKIPKKVFNNEITLIYKYWAFKHINLKIFSNGKLQMTGIIDPNFETTHIGTQLINSLKCLKYRVYVLDGLMNGMQLANIKHHDFIVVWNGQTQQLDFMRRNIAFHELDNILQNGIGYNYCANDWQISINAKQTFMTYIAKADAELVPLEQLRMDLLNTYDYPEALRHQLFIRLAKFKKIKKLEKKHLKLDNKKFMDIMIECVVMYISYIKMYKLRIHQLLDTDVKFVDTIRNKYFTNKDVDGKIILPVVVTATDTEATSFWEFDTEINTYPDYKISDIAIELINSDYNNRFNNNLIKLNELFNSPEYNIYNYYKPDAKYAGIIAKYMYNSETVTGTMAETVAAGIPSGAGTVKYSEVKKEGKCYCATSCITSDKKKCVSVSISIFRPGSIIITAGKDVGQLVRVYNYLNALFKKHFATISYTDIHDNKDHFLLNEERKIMRKETLVYIKRCDIRIPGVNDNMPVKGTVNASVPEKKIEPVPAMKEVTTMNTAPKFDFTNTVFNCNPIQVSVNITPSSNTTRPKRKPILKTVSVSLPQ